MYCIFQELWCICCKTPDICAITHRFLSNWFLFQFKSYLEWHSHSRLKNQIGRCVSGSFIIYKAADFLELLRTFIQGTFCISAYNMCLFQLFVLKHFPICYSTKISVSVPFLSSRMAPYYLQSTFFPVSRLISMTKINKVAGGLRGVNWG